MIYNSEGPELIRGRIWLTVFILFLGYGVVNVFVPNADMIVAARILQAAASAVVIYIYWKDAFHAFFTPEPKRTDYLIVGIVFGFGATLFQALFSIIFRFAGAPLWLTNAEFNAPYILLSVLAGVLHVSAPGAVDGVVPRRNRIAIGVGFGLAVAGVCGLLAAKPDLSAWVEAVRPYVGDSHHPH